MTLPGIVGDSGIIEEVVFGPINSNDFKVCEDMLLTSRVLKPGDILINDRGFMDRSMINFLKEFKRVDTYVPVKKNMDIYKMAVSIAKEDGKWEKHPDPNRKDQMISLVTDLGNFYQLGNGKNDVDLNACVIWFTEDDNYAVIITTDITKSARMITKTYALRNEIEEDFRQLKDFWKLEDFKSTKQHMIAFHIICVLFGYLFFQLYRMTPEGEALVEKCLPIVLKNYIPKLSPHVVMYSGDIFGVLAFHEILEIHSKCNERTQNEIIRILKTI